MKSPILWWPVLTSLLSHYSEAAAPPTGFESDVESLSKRQMAPENVTNAQGPVPLWFGEGPTYYDVVQKEVYDCWLAAASVSVVIASDNWVQHLLSGPSNESLVGQSGPSLDKVRIQLWDPSTGQQHHIAALASLQSNTEDRPWDRWWNSAIMQGMLIMGTLTDIRGVYPNLTFHETGGYASDALFALTGYSTVTKGTGWYGFTGVKDDPWYNRTENVDLLWNDLYSAWLNKSPLVLSTKAGKEEDNGTLPDTRLYANHAYALMWPETHENGTRVVHLRNPWGRSEEYTLDNVLANMLRLMHLRGYQGLDWEKATNGTKEAEGEENKEGEEGKDGEDVDDKFWGKPMPVILERYGQVEPNLTLPEEPPVWETGLINATTTLDGATTTYQRLPPKETGTSDTTSTKKEESEQTTTSETTATTTSTETSNSTTTAKEAEETDKKTHGESGDDKKDESEDKGKGNDSNGLLAMEKDTLNEGPTTSKPQHAIKPSFVTVTSGTVTKTMRHAPSPEGTKMDLGRRVVDQSSRERRSRGRRA